jgi:soluble lytic murein transglycosylase
MLLLVAVAAAAFGAFTYLQRTEPTWWARIWYPLRYQAIVRGHAAHYSLNPALLAAVIEQESKFKADARSSTGAIGLMQLLPDTAKGIAIHTGGNKFVVADLDDPEINVRYGSWYLRHLLDKYQRKGEGIQFSETRAYVDRVERLKDIYRRAYASELGLD